MGSFESKKPEPDPFFDSPWRTVDWNNKEALLQKMKACNRGDQDIKHIRILLYGPVGAGKSSFVNSVNSCLGRELLGNGIFTRKFKTHKIKDFPLLFIMGHEERGGIHKDDLKLAMEGHIKDGYTFNPAEAISAKDCFYNPEPAPGDKVHVLVCVVPADKIAVLDPAITEKMQAMILVARDLDIPQLCIVTRIDLFHDVMATNIKHVYTMRIVKQRMEQVSAVLGIPLHCILPVKNYHEECELQNDIDVLILKAVQHMFNLGEDFIDQM